EEMLGAGLHQRTNWPTSYSKILDLLSACRIGNLAGIIDCGIFMNLRFVVRRFGTFELFASVVVGRDARSFCRLKLRLVRLSLRVWLCYELPGDSTLAPWLDGPEFACLHVPSLSVRG